jgi:pyruvate/2-oxoglutarate dehydrogenase complex dihydrolipoamide dehydrogenase (E3) component
MPEEFDVIVLGGGAVGEHAVGRCADAGLSTALVERELVGGECSYWACMPSKTLLRPGQVLAAARRVPGASEAVTGELDAQEALARRDWMVSSWDDRGQVGWVEGTGSALVRGRGRLAGERRVEVEFPAGPPRSLSARRAVILATGSTPVVPPVAGLRETRTWDNRDATSARKVPGRLLVLGGGAVGVEMAQAWHRLGSGEVSVVEAAEHLLPAEEPFAGAEVATALAQEGVRVVTGARLVEARRTDEDGPLSARLGDGGAISADEILLATGRRPNTSDIGLETVGLDPAGPIEVDDSLCASAVPGRWLYAVGDVNGKALLTHMGKYQARVAVAALLGQDVSAVAGHRAVPRVVFTDPQVAAVGMTERQAREAGIPARAVRVRLQDVAAAAIAGAGVAGTAQLVLDESRGVIVGATFTGPDIEGILHSATVAIVGEVPMKRLWHVVASFPTFSEVWLSLIEEYAKGRGSGPAPRSLG